MTRNIKYNINDIKANGSAPAKLYISNPATKGSENINRLKEKQRILNQRGFAFFCIITCIQLKPPPTSPIQSSSDIVLYAAENPV